MKPSSVGLHVPNRPALLFAKAPLYLREGNAGDHEHAVAGHGHPAWIPARICTANSGPIDSTACTESTDARRLAQRGVPIIALIRAYRIGHGRFLSRCLDELAHRSPDADLAAAVTSRMIEVTLRYIDCISEQVITDYQHERDQWMLTQTAVRAGRVRAMLGDKPIDVEATGSALGYRLRQQHLGVVPWVTDAVHGSDGLTRLDRLTSAAARALGAHGRPLFVPRD